MYLSQGTFSKNKCLKFRKVSKNIATIFLANRILFDSNPLYLLYPISLYRFLAFKITSVFKMVGYAEKFVRRAPTNVQIGEKIDKLHTPLITNSNTLVKII